MPALLILQIFLSTLVLMPGKDHFTDCIFITGHVKNAKHEIVRKRHNILVYQGVNSLVSETITDNQGRMSFDVCLGIPEVPTTVDFFTVVDKDTLLLASIEYFDTDGEMSLDLFLPNKLIAKQRKCVKCKRSDGIYELVYNKPPSKKFTRAACKFYCLYDKVKF
jgi:hypothetical protein